MKNTSARLVKTRRVGIFLLYWCLVTYNTSQHASMELPGLGSNCAFPGCGQLDFLPFHCKACDEYFCLEHRSSHRCATASGESTCVICPLCACSVKYVEGENINVTFERHTQTTCDPSKYTRTAKKSRCPVPGCKEKLTSVNTYKCKDCGTSVCLKHRFPADHACGKSGQPPADAMRLLSMQAAQGRAAAAPPPKAAPPRAQLGMAPPPLSRSARPVPAPPAPTQAVLRAPAPQRSNSPAAASQPTPASVSGAQVGTAPAGPERCDVCGARFPDVMALITHAEVAHMGGGQPALTPQRNATPPALPRVAQPPVQRSPSTSSGMRGGATGTGAGPAGREVCPRCGMRFHDVTALVAHVEAKHERSSSSSQCMVC